MNRMQRKKHKICYSKPDSRATDSVKLDSCATRPDRGAIKVMPSAIKKSFNSPSLKSFEDFDSIVDHYAAVGDPELVLAARAAVADLRRQLRQHRLTKLNRIAS